MKLSLSTRLHLPLIPLILVGVVVAWLARTGLRDNAQELVRARQVKELAVKSLALLLTQDDASKALMLDGSSNDASMRKIQAYDEGQQVFAQLEKLTRAPVLLGLIGQLKAIDEKELRPLDTELLESMSEGKADVTLKMFSTKYEPVRARYETTLRQLVDAAETEAAQAAQAMQSRNEWSFRSICFALGGGVVVVAAILLLVTRRVSRSLRQATEQLTQEAESASQTSQKFRQSSQSLAEGAGDQAASLEEASASLGEMSTMTKRNAEHASAAKTLAGQTRQAAEAGAASMQEMCAAMAGIKDASDGISKIIKTIDEIAFQTNILALNAAVEAARAGEAGMGFAVVADEVRRLAQRSAQAAQETAQRIQDSIGKSDLGAQLSERVSTNFVDIVSRARQTDDLTAQIAHASVEQNQGLQQIADATNRMEGITQRNAATASEGAEAAEELTAQASRVRDAVQQLSDILGQRRPASTVPADPPDPGEAGYTPTSGQMLAPLARGRSVTVPRVESVSSSGEELRKSF
jgi:hypothetical protein